jgi:hypothetical protein
MLIATIRRPSTVIDIGILALAATVVAHVVVDENVPTWSPRAPEGVLESLWSCGRSGAWSFVRGWWMEVLLNVPFIPSTAAARTLGRTRRLPLLANLDFLPEIDPMIAGSSPGRVGRFA